MKFLQNKCFFFTAIAGLFFGFGFACTNQEASNPQNQADSTFYFNSMSDFTVVFYNTENFYDTIDDPNTYDDEFTPQGRIPWTPKRFNKKVYNLSKVLCEVVKPHMPDIIGLAEIENRAVLEALIREPHMAKTDYGIVHYDSPDERGIDVALLYNKNTFRVLVLEPIRVSLAGIEDRTRDILHVTGKTQTNQDLHIFVNHWPSRREGQQESEKRRFVPAGILREHVDKIFDRDPTANIIIVGDFNDNPDNRSITEVLSVQKPILPADPGRLYNLTYPLYKKGLGSLYYKHWNLFDQIIVSGNLLDAKKVIFCKPNDADVFNPRWLLHFDRNHFEPNRTMAAKYYGGYSDHLPVFLKFRKGKGLAPTAEIGFSKEQIN